MNKVYWLEQTEVEVRAENDWLSAAELAFLNATRFAKRRTDWWLGRWTAKLAVAAHLNIPPNPASLSQIEVRAAPSGAPEVFFANRLLDATISLSHREGIAICAISPSGAALGCDLETVEPRGDAFLNDYFTYEEQALVAASCLADRSRLVALLWSAKESALKALHIGLRLDTRSIIVSPCGLLASVSQDRDDAEWRPLRACCTTGEILGGWWRWSGTLVRTVAATPWPLPPIPINHYSC